MKINEDFENNIPLVLKIFHNYLSIVYYQKIEGVQYKELRRAFFAGIITILQKTDVLKFVPMSSDHYQMLTQISEELNDFIDFEIKGKNKDGK